MDIESTKKLHGKIRRGEFYLAVGEWQEVFAALDYVISSQAPAIPA